METMPQQLLAKHTPDWAEDKPERLETPPTAMRGALPGPSEPICIKLKTKDTTPEQPKPANQDHRKTLDEEELEEEEKPL